MTRNDARGTILGLLAAIGYICWMAWLLNLLIGIGTMAASFWTFAPYSLAFGMGFCGLVVVLRGSWRALAGVRFDRGMEFPPEVEGADQRW